MKTFFSLFCLFFLAILPFSPHAQASDDPISLLKTTQEKLKSIIKRDIPKSDTKAKNQQEVDLKALMRPFFDFQKLGQDAMSKHWEKLNEEQRKRFLFWLEALLENAYIRSLHQGGMQLGSDEEPKIEYKKQKVQKTKATVYTEIRFRDKKRDKWKKVRLNWLFFRRDGRWMVSDILTNDNSLVETYQEQFDKIITKHSFDELIKRISKKVNELRKEDGLSQLSYSP
jgi:phospholipid transport system substrate-binding protein